MYNIIFLLGLRNVLAHIKISFFSSCISITKKNQFNKLTHLNTICCSSLERVECSGIIRNRALLRPPTTELFCNCSNIFVISAIPGRNTNIAPSVGS